MAKVYVGTYAKYNNGSIAGRWLNLEDYSDKEEFLEACRELHADEDDPELMFQDWEDIPEGMIGESHIDEEVWEWLELDADEQELLAVYREHVNQYGSIDEAREAYAGKADTEADFAQEWYEETGQLEDCPEHLRYYIDWDAVARDMRLGGDFCFVRHGGDVWAFYNN